MPKLCKPECFVLMVGVQGGSCCHGSYSKPHQSRAALLGWRLAGRFHPRAPSPSPPPRAATWGDEAFLLEGRREVIAF